MFASMKNLVILLPSADSRRVVVSYKRKYVHKVLVNRLSLPRKCRLIMTIAVDSEINLKQNKKEKKNLV